MVPYTFVPRINFEHVEKGRLVSRYRQGMSYTVRNDALHALVEQWAKDNKVFVYGVQLTARNRAGEAQAQPGRVQGKLITGEK